MNSNQDDNKTSIKRVRLPKPNPANMTVLIDNVPKNPIFPWNKYYYPWPKKEAELEQSESEQQNTCE